MYIVRKQRIQLLLDGGSSRFLQVAQLLLQTVDQVVVQGYQTKTQRQARSSSLNEFWGVFFGNKAFKNLADRPASWVESLGEKQFLGANPSSIPLFYSLQTNLILLCWLLMSNLQGIADEH